MGTDYQDFQLMIHSCRGKDATVGALFTCLRRESLVMSTFIQKYRISHKKGQPQEIHPERACNDTNQVNNQASQTPLPPSRSCHLIHRLIWRSSHQRLTFAAVISSYVSVSTSSTQPHPSDDWAKSTLTICSTIATNGSNQSGEPPAVIAACMVPLRLKVARLRMMSAR